MVWPATIPLFVYENSTEYTAMNKPLLEIISRTDWLKQQVDQITAGRNLVALYDSVDDTVEVGDPVYLETSTGTLKKALAKFAGEFAVDGSLRLAESGYVLGIVTEKPNATTAKVFTNGTIVDQVLADSAFGVSADAGTYRLSMTIAGELTSDEQDIDILVAQYDGAGGITLMDKRAAIPNHIHQAYLLEQNWLVVADSSFDDMEKPAGATHGYDISNDPNMQRIFGTIAGHVRVFGDGTLATDDILIANKDNIWSFIGDPTVTYTETIEASAILPYSYGEPLLRGAKSNTPEELLLSALQGILTVDMAPWAYEDVAAVGKAVTAFDGRTAQRVPVITSVNAVGDILAPVNPVTGEMTLSLGQGINTFLEPAIVNLNNAIEANDGYYTYYALPADRDSFMLGRISLPYFSSGTLMAAIVAEVVGQSGGGAFPALTVSHITKPYPVTDESRPSAWDATFALPTPTVAANNGRIIEADVGNRFAVTSRGTVYLKVEFDTPSEDIKITRFGVILYTV